MTDRPPVQGDWIRLPDGSRAQVAPLSGALCDFCSSQAVRWCYPANTFALEAYQWASVGNWGACEPCAALIEADDLPGLTERCVTVLTPEVERMLGGPEPLDVHQARASFAATLHVAFRINRCGERHPDHPIPEGGLVGPHDYPRSDR